MMNRAAKIFLHDRFVGTLLETDIGYEFIYDANYVNMQSPYPISKTLPVQVQSYKSNTLFPFFDGLIPEGWLLDIAQKNWKLEVKDRFGLLLVCCEDCIGAVSVKGEESVL
jgi:serine/threonine-protein kinase HipA